MSETSSVPSVVASAVAEAPPGVKASEEDHEETAESMQDEHDEVHVQEIAPSCANVAPKAATPSAVAPTAPSATLPSRSANASRRSASQPSVRASGVRASDVNSGPHGSQLVYALGELSYDFGFEARLDYFIQQLGGKEANPLDPVKMADHLKNQQEDSNALIWTLHIDGNPVYAIEPADQFAVITYLRLVDFLVAQENEGVERISLAGSITGHTRLFNGTVIPTVSPVLRGMFNWNIESLITACFGARPPEGDAARPRYDEQTKQMRSFLERIYYELRNLGTSQQHRAMNFAATNAFQAKEVFVDAVKEDLVLDTIGVEPSPICRPDSDCWDVQLRFFDPKKIHERARKIYRYTVDISDFVPVTVGTLRTWFVY